MYPVLWRKNCVFPCVFGNVLSLGYGLQIWICGTQGCASNSKPVILPGSLDCRALLNPISFLAPNGLAHLFAGSYFLQSFLPSWKKRVFTCISDIVVELMIVSHLKLLVWLCWCAKFCCQSSQNMGRHFLLHSLLWGSDLWQQTLRWREGRGKRRKKRQ